MTYTAVSTFALVFTGSYFSFSIGKWANNQIYWTLLFFVSAYICRKEGGITAIAKGLIIASIVTALISIPEFINKRVPWIGYVPRFLIGDPEIYAIVSDSQSRLNFDQYRARSSFNVSLSFAEFLSLGLPFLLHAAVMAKKFLNRCYLILATILVLYAMSILTGARSGMIGLIVGLFGYAAFWAFRRWKTKSHDLVGAASFFAFPAAAIAFAGLVLTWNRLKVMVIGGGQHSFSDNAREVQWDRAFNNLMTNPLGFGTSRAGQVIGYKNLAGVGTLDSGYINLLIDTGIIGFVAFYVMNLTAIFYGLRIAVRTDDKDLQFGAPAAIALTSLLIIKSVLSQPENLPVAFVLCGAVAALHWKSQRVSSQIARAGGSA